MQTIINYLPSFMQLPLFWVLAILAVAVVLFIQNKLRMDVIALMVLLAFSLSGILTTKEALAGFGDPNVILLALLYIIGDALVRTGVANQMSDWLLRVAGASEAKVIALLMLSIGTLGAFMSSTGIVAIFIPVTLAICASLNISPRRLMMPLAVAGLISGMMTLIATAPNLVTHAELVKAGYEGFHFFSFTPIGALVLVLGILYMLAVRRWLDDGSVPVVASNEDSMAHLIEEYKLNGRAKMVVLSENSHFIGKTIDELNLRSVYQLNIIAIQRYKNFRHITLAAFGKDQLQKKDILLMDIGVDEARFVQLCEEFGMQPIELKGEYFSTQSKSVGMAELGVMPETETIGQTVDALNFRSNFGLSVVGIKREGQILQNNLLTETVKSGDILLVMVVAIASSAAFMTPISPVNSMVVSLGNYRFSDFLKVGLPFTVITMLVTAFLVPILFP
ncbi:SLC13 family permease [Actinobacillus suis]|uniref:Di- and tricarboxylate transporter n=2 Tax=Actinobacillus suis TaxID=716 RepID=K0FZM4_ACTSU|nr:SLC13 family permease [Actinobacillus suis]AFU20017.1 hypothetical protein ASU2_09435 [Actinobacillus suis H91-0380]AIJ32156.1 hypothetical protein ASU1_09495 [Actinobacillus suis ATCC 33415]MCO4167864.1 anion permease [Actinobacillus suis]MCO4169760.1 anion permease [Actinobacillus suis]MCQ9630964.1 anion permease [Actinobacillus suis]